MKYLFGIWLSLLLLIGNTSQSQDLEKLRSEREQYLKEISLSEELLQKTASDRQSSMQELNLIQSNIKNRQRIIDGINRELVILRRQIRNYELEIVKLEDEIEKKKETYSKIIYKVFLSQKSYNKAQYILAAADFNQAFKRIKYVQQYSKFRKEQLESIHQKTLELKEKREKLESDKREKDKLVVENQRSIINLNNDQRQQERVVKQLQSKEKQIRQQIDEKKRAYKMIEDEIEKILAAAVGAETGSTGLRMTPEEKILSNEFSQNKGRLPWPVTRGVVTSKVGKQNHEVLKMVQVENKGIGITTESGAPVLAVFEGKVMMVAVMQGMNNTVLVKHGEFFTVYQNLVDVKVKKGDRVTLKMEIGRAYKEAGASTSEIQFGIWKGTEVLNPEEWLAK